MTTHSRVLAWRMPWTEEPVSYGPWGRTTVGDDVAAEHTASVFLA